MNLTMHSTASAPAASRPLLDGIEADLGLVPNMAATIAESPTLLAAFDGLRRAVGGGTLDPVLREIAGLAVGVAVDNRYGVAFHSTVLSGLGVPDGDLDAMRAGRAPSEPRQAAVYAFARDVVLARGKSDSTAARDAGLSAEEVLEVVAECTFAGLVGVVDNLTGRVTLDDFLAPRAW